MWPFTRSKTKKDLFDISAQDVLRAMYQHTITAGVGLPLQDKPESYVNDGYAGNADVYSLISKIDAMSKQGRIKLVQRNGNGQEAEVTGHPLNDFLYYVNPAMSFDMFWSASHIYKLTVGNNYWYKPVLEFGTNKGKTLELFIMPAQFTEVIQGTRLDPIKGYKLNFNPVVNLERDKVFHQKFFDPRFDTTFFMYGLSPIKAAAQTVSKLNQAEVTEQRAFENSSPPYILFRKNSGNSVYDGFSTDQKKELEKEMTRLVKDEKRGKPLIAKFEPDIVRLGVSPVDLGVIESSVAGMRTLCNAYRFPSVLMNDTANSTYNNITTARKAAWTDCIIPLNKTLANDLTYCLTHGIDEYEPFYFVYDVSDVEEMQDALEKKVIWMSKAGWSKNEIRQATGKERIENPIMDEPIFNQGEIPLSDMSYDIEPDKDFIDYEDKK